MNQPTSLPTTKPATLPPRILEVRQGLLKANDMLAWELREEFAAAGVYAVNVVSGPGAGKTELLARTLSMFLERGRKVAAIVGDLATENDARRLEASGARARQIITGTVCHLEASMVRKALEGWDLAGLDYLFIENVGNLVCPASFDLGEHLRVLLFPVTEGEDKPLKYPTLINTADVTLISKIDLAEAVQFNRARARANLDLARPGAAVLEVSARTGSGLETWLDLLEARRASSEPFLVSTRVTKK
ncbi:MAG: hydrogenase nickel incorporation protein HypB [Isosphaeraceae bacterium]